MRRTWAWASGSVCLAAALVLFLRHPAKADLSAFAHAGEQLGVAAVATWTLSSSWRQPIRCGRHDALAAAEPWAEFELIGGLQSRGDEQKRALRLAAIADTRGRSAATLANVAWLHRELVARQAQAVLVLGGIGDDRETIEAVLDALSTDATWVVLALPGDREPVVPFRAAVAALRERGREVYDLSAAAGVRLHGVTIVGVPGVPPAASGRASSLADVEGCVLHDADLEARVESLGTLEKPVIVVSHLPPRQHGPNGTDLSLDGVHVGVPAWNGWRSKLLPLAWIHGFVDEAAGGSLTESGARVGARDTEGRGGVMATGALEAAPLRRADGTFLGGSALWIEIQGERIRTAPLTQPWPVPAARAR